MPDAQNNTAPPLPNPHGEIREWSLTFLHKGFESIVDAQPLAPAIILGDHTISYGELDLQANALAHALLDAGLRPQEPVGVLVARSHWLPCAFLAILKAGGVYVPMTADQPEERLGYMIKQANMRLVLALDGLNLSSTLQESCIVMRPEAVDLTKCQRPLMSGQADDLAVILFTSGSTGRPKGVLLQHNAVVNMALAHVHAHQITPQDRLLLSSAPGFILGFRELCLPLASGAAYVPVSRAILDNPLQVQEIMARQGVSMALFTPSYLRLFDGAIPAGLRCILTAGERPNADDARHYARHLDYWNMHGATEVCGTICMHHVSPYDEGALPSGLPFYNTSVRLLAEDGQDVPYGEIGEIHVYSKSLARGYLGEAELTASSFVETVYGRAYRSRDLGRWTEKGLLSLGRNDDMVKISGQSISLGEIESALTRHSTITRAAAIHHQGRLLAFAESSAPLPVNWREFLARSLPGYMIPAEITVVETLPIASAGKVDRNALIALLSETQDRSRQGALQTPLENEIAVIWEAELAVSGLGRHDYFYAIGGTSLAAITIALRLQGAGYAVTAPMVLASPTIESLALRLESLSSSHSVEDWSSEGPATLSQQDFWIAAQIDTAAANAHVARAFTVIGPTPDASIWQQLWSQVLKRHPALRTAFVAEGTNVFWRTEAELESPLIVHTCTLRSQAGAAIRAQAEHPFDLTASPLARAGLVRIVETNETVFWFVLSHAVVDGLSARLLQEDIFALLQNQTLKEAPNGIALASRSEQLYLTSPAAEVDRAYWMGKLASFDEEAFHELPADRPRPATPSGKGAIPLTRHIGRDTLDGVTALARTHKVGIHALLLAVLAAEVERRTGRNAVMIGTGVSNRPAGAEGALGHFVNIVPVLLARSPSLAEHLTQAQATLTEALAHADYPSGLVYRQFRKDRPKARNPARTSLFDVSLTGVPSRVTTDEQSGFRLAPADFSGELGYPAAGIDLAFSYEPVAGGLDLTLLWNPDIYDRATAEEWVESFAHWADWLAADPDRALSSLPALRPEEDALLDQWEHGPTLYAPPRLRSETVFEARVDAGPDRAALITADGETSLTQLDQIANRFAHGLIDAGIQPGQVVAILTECCAELPGAVLGIWKAGAIYMPLALGQPPERLAFMAQDAKARALVILGGADLPEPLAHLALPTLRPEDVPPKSTRPLLGGLGEDLAYIIYTSGTTGRPKGIGITHQAMVNVALETGRIAELRADDRVALAVVPSFDASLWEMGLGLLYGLALVPISPELRDDPWGLKDYYRHRGVTVAFQAPSYLRIAKDVPFQGLRVLLTGGEAPCYDDARMMQAQGCLFWNAYGPTETCVLVSLALMTDPDPDRPLPAGRPLGQTTISIRNADGVKVPPGVVGEVWLGGVGVAPQGYLNKPDLSAEVSIDTPQGRFYRSGDLGRWTSDGLLELAGRDDHQIKLHGQRLELGEIEQAVKALPQVADCLVLVEEGADGTKVLRGFAHPSVPKGWHESLAQHLPHYMIPASLTAYDRLPLTPAGKVDRTALLALVHQSEHSGQRTPPQGDMECRIAAVWRDLLKSEPCREDDFFALGGNSLSAVTTVHRLSQQLDLAIPARELFAASTLTGFAARLSGRLANRPDQAVLFPSSDLATEGEREFWVAEQAGLNTSAFTMPLTRLVGGAIPAPKAWNEAWSVLVQRHPALRCCYAETDGALRRRTHSQVTQGLEFNQVPTRAAALAFIRQRQSQPFTLTQAPLWRAGVVQTELGETLFWLAQHHATSDGISLGVLQAELGALLQGQSLKPLESDFGQSAARESAYLNGSECAQDKGHWSRVLGALPEAAFDEAPLDYPRSANAKAGCHRLTARLSPTTAQVLNTLARKNNASLHAALTALLTQEVRRRTAHGDVIIGTTADMRDTQAETDVIGYYVNMLPLAFTSQDDASFVALLVQAQDSLAAALAHGRYPFARIYDDLRKSRSLYSPPSRFPLFDVAITENPPLSHPGSRLHFLPPYLESLEYEHTDTAHGQDMVLIHESLADGGILLQWHVNSALYRRETAESWFASIIGWADWLAADPDRALSSLPALRPEEDALLDQWEHGPTLYAPPRLRSETVFEARVDAGPDGAALITADGETSLTQLDQIANRFAHGLIDAGIQPGQVVAILTECCAELPGAVLGIWKAGAIYMPLALGQPPERLAFMAQDAKARALVILGGADLPEPLAHLALPTLRPEDVPPKSTRPLLGGLGEDLAYIIYTSGTTGRPKGVGITHQAMVNAAFETGRIAELRADDRVALAVVPSFDASLWEMGLGLLYGLALVPISPELRDDPWGLKDYYRHRGVTVAFQAPSYLRLAKDVPFEGLRVLFCGGEAPRHDDVEMVQAQGCLLWNGYGPTETCMLVSLALLTDPDPDRPLPAGRPLGQTTISIRNADGVKVPPGVVGEVWLGGVGVAPQGYLNKPDLSAEVFIDTPQGRFYRSGDLGRWTSDGLLELAGRDDHQIKLHGQRLELGEIEQAVKALPQVADCLVLVEEGADGTKVLRGFAHPSVPKGWHESLAQHLPHYMIPASLTAYDRLPLTPAGKVDRTALLALVHQSEHSGQRTPPQGDMECRIAAVWRDLLKSEPCREDDFFALGGNSLSAVTTVHRLSQQLDLAIPARELFMSSTLTGFAARLSDRLANRPDQAVLLPSIDLATEGEREFWVAEQAGLNTSAFTMFLIQRVSGAIPTLKAWNEAWSVLVQRHPALRCCYAETDGALRRRTLSQVTQGQVTQGLEFNQVPTRAAALAFIRQRQSQPFTLTQAPLWRAGVVQTELGETLFWLAQHHATSDGISLGVLQAELGALLQGQSLKPLESDFGQSAARESAYLNGSECAQDKGHWSRVLGALSEAAFDEAPLDYPRSANAKAGCHRLQARLSPAVGQALNRLARKNNASLHALAMALVALEARRRFGKDEMIIGTPADMRDNLAESSVIGCYVNMLPLPLFHQRGQSFQALLQHTQQALASALAHGRYPFARIYHDFWSDHPLPRHPSRYPLFDLAVTEVPIVQQQNASLQFHPLKGESLGISYEKVQNSPGQDMVLNHESLSDGGLVLQWQVNSAVYGKETAEAWLHAFLSWAEWLAEDISRAEAPVPALLPQEAALLRRWEYGEAVDRPVVRAHELFEATLDGGLDQRPALITRTYSLSYRQLEEEANILAHAVLSRQIGRGDVVGVISGRSANLPAAALAVWKAGATYLPLAADLPPERLAYMMEDAGAKLVLVLDQHPLAPSCPCLRPEDLSKQFRQDHRYRPGLAGNCSDIAYIIYTSGSTGRPKGTLISHGAYVNFVLGAAESLGLNAHDRCLTFSSPSFDVSLSDMGVPLAIGAAMCPLPQDILNSPTQFLEFLTDLEITAADMTPTYLRLFDGADLGKLRVLVTGGEPPFAAEIQKYSGHLRYFNAYGPTENTITSAMGLVSADCAGQPSCGRPLPNTSIHICDPDGNPVPPGVIGEVWLGGAGLAKGYLGRPDLTAASFVDTPQGCRYRTGDLGRWILDGELEILGRIDTQVKLRGQRVELGEIESVLENHPSVKQAIAVIHAPEGSQPILWAFACLHTGNDAPHQAEWHAYLSRSLPSYMVPASVIKIDVVPTNSSGKVDLKALLAGLTEADAHAAQSRTPPRTATEQRIAQIWAEQFNGRTISREDGFFELGGDSLRAIAVVSQLRREFHCAINDLYEHPVLADFALCCHPREDHLRMVLEKAKAHWCAYHDDLANYEALRDRELGRLQRQYELKSQDLLSQNLTVRRNYDCVLITGATGYVGSYLLRELCRDSQRRITALVRGKDVTAARARLGAVLCDYFGADTGEALLNDPRLTVLAGDLRRDDLGLASADYEQLSTTMRAIFHCAANVNHYGHYSEFHQTNVVATERLLKLAAGCSQGPADFHLISTTSVVPKPPEQSFHLFTEFDSVPDEPNSNYYIRTKQEAERRVVAARSYLSNACIHRIGNVVFASDGTTLQRNIKDNAFFRQVAAYCQLGAVPDDSHVWMCHVDIIGKAVLALAETACLVNETHHLEHSRRDFLADIVMPTATRICSFGEFLARLSQAIDEPDMQVAFAETMGNYKLYRGLSPQPQFRRLELTAQRTNRILEKLGLFWPDLPTDGQTRLLQEALQLFRQ